MNYFNVCTYTIASLLVNLDCTGCNREHHGKVEKHRPQKKNDLTEQTGDVKEVEPQTTLNRQSCGSKSLDYMPANHFFRSVRMYRGCVLHVVQYIYDHIVCVLLCIFSMHMSGETRIEA